MANKRRMHSALLKLGDFLMDTQSLKFQTIRQIHYPTNGLGKAKITGQD